MYYSCRHLDGAVLETLSRPSLLITDAYNALNVQARRKERDQALLSEWSKGGGRLCSSAEGTGTSPACMGLYSSAEGTCTSPACMGLYSSAEGTGTSPACMGLCALVLKTLVPPLHAWGSVL